MVHGPSLTSYYAPGTSRCYFGPNAVPIERSANGTVTCHSPAYTVGPVEVRLTLNGDDMVVGAPPVAFAYYAEPYLLSVAPVGGPVRCAPPRRIPPLSRSCGRWRCARDPVAANSGTYVSRP